MATETTTIEATLRNHLAQEILFTGQVYPHSDTASFLENGIVDSMGIMQLVMFVEEHFGVVVNDADIVPDNFDSVARLAAYIRNAQA
jgi:acyl carrier protein